MEPTARRAAAVATEPASACLPHLIWQNRAISFSNGNNVLPPAANRARQRPAACSFGSLGRLLGRRTVAHPSVAAATLLCPALVRAGLLRSLWPHHHHTPSPPRNALSFVSLAQDEASGGLTPASSAHWSRAGSRKGVILESGFPGSSWRGLFRLDPNRWRDGQRSRVHKSDPSLLVGIRRESERPLGLHLSLPAFAGLISRRTNIRPSPRAKRGVFPSRLARSLLPPP
jgi:hypothetical protein